MFFRMSLLISAIIFMQTVGAQGLSTISTLTVATQTDQGMKNTSYRLSSAAVPAKTMSSFNEHFPDVARPVWSQLENKFLVKFFAEGVQTNVLMNKSGGIIYVVRYGTEKDLPLETRKTIRRLYASYTILNAVEVNQDAISVWVVTIEEAGNVIVLSVKDGEITEVDHYISLK